MHAARKIQACSRRQGGPPGRLFEEFIGKDVKAPYKDGTQFRIARGVLSSINNGFVKIVVIDNNVNKFLNILAKLEIDYSVINQTRLEIENSGTTFTNDAHDIASLILGKKSFLDTKNIIEKVCSQRKVYLNQ